MDTIVLKFGGSSVANNTNLNFVANKIIDLKEKNNNIVVVVSAQGKTTDDLIKQAKEISALPNERELDALVNVGEQISASKIAMLLNRMGHPSVSLNAYQAGIYTNGDFQRAKITHIDTSRIEKELKDGKIVIITGFQGIDKYGNITTLGRGGSDTSAVAIASVLKAKHCYIFSDVDGVYTTDPRKVTEAKKLDFITYKEMEYASNEGAKVLHDRCVELADKYNLPIIAASTFNDNVGTVISNNKEDSVEGNSIKSIIKNDDILIVTIPTKENSYCIMNSLVSSESRFGNFEVLDYIKFTVLKAEREKVENILENFNVNYNIIETTKISIVGTGISNNNEVIKVIMKILGNSQNDVISIDVSSYKISIQFNRLMDNTILNKLHEKLV